MFYAFFLAEHEKCLRMTSIINIHDICLMNFIYSEMNTECIQRFTIRGEEPQIALNVYEYFLFQHEKRLTHRYNR